MAIIMADTIQLNEVQGRQNAELAYARRHDGKILDLIAKIARQEQRLEPWVRAKLADAPGEHRSIQLRHGATGLRWTRPAINFLEGWTEDLVLAKLRKLKGLRKAYIRVKETLNCQAILHDARPESGNLTAAQMRRFGVEIKREERFYTDPKIDDVTP